MTGTTVGLADHASRSQPPPSLSAYHRRRREAQR